MISASGHRPSGASNNVSRFSGVSSRPKNRSTKMALCPFSRRALHTEEPVTRETSRSVDSPPANTTIFMEIDPFCLCVSDTCT